MTEYFFNFASIDTTEYTIDTTDAMEDFCLLCLEVQQSNEEFWDGIKADTRTWQELNIKTVLEKHFWPLNEILLPSSWICLKCWQNVRAFHKFYLRVEEVQIRAGKLRTIKTELQTYDYLEPEVVINQIKPLQDAVDIKTESPFDEPGLDYIPFNQIHSTETKLAKDPLKNPNQSTIEEKESNTKSLTDDEEWQENELDVSNCSTDCDISSSNQNGDALDSMTPAKRPRVYVKRGKNYKDNDFFIMEHFKQIICDLCKVELKDFADMQKHFTNVHKQVGYLVCCSNKFYHRNRLVDHIHTHLNPEHFKCDQCGKILSDRGKLKSHRLSVHRPSDVQLSHACDVCGKSFTTANVLRRHKLTHLPEEEKKFPCSDCGKLYASSYLLKLHRDVLHLNKFAKVCYICGLTLRTSTEYKAHMNKHEGLAANLNCDICGLRLTSEGGLKVHKDTQHPVGGKQEHKCPICFKVSPTLRALKKHVNTMHEKGYEYKCSLCEKAFRRPEGLKEHMASHTGTALYTCPWCPKTFNSNGNMHAHRKKMHPKEWEEAKLKKYTGVVPQ